MASPSTPDASRQSAATEIRYGRLLMCLSRELFRHFPALGSIQRKAKSPNYLASHVPQRLHADFKRPAPDREIIVSRLAVQRLIMRTQDCGALIALTK